MSPAELQAIQEANEERRARKAAAKPGPWAVQSHAIKPTDPGHYAVIVDAPGYPSAHCYATKREENAAFIAAARNDDCEAVIDNLLAEIEKLTAERDAAQRDAERWKWCEANVELEGRIGALASDVNPNPREIMLASFWLDGDEPETFAQAVDAAIREQKEPHDGTH